MLLGVFIGALIEYSFAPIGKIFRYAGARIAGMGMLLDRKVTKGMIAEDVIIKGTIMFSNPKESTYEPDGLAVFMFQQCKDKTNDITLQEGQYRCYTNFRMKLIKVS